MRSFLKHTGVIVAFLAGLLAILLLLSFVVNPKDNSAQAGMKDPTAMGFLGEPSNSIDVLVLGDSESYSSIIPIQLWQQQGITSYVCGSHAQRLCYSEELMKRAFDCQSPKVVILETNALYRKISFAYSLRHSLEQFMPVFRYHNRWKSLTLRDFDFTVNYNHMEVNKGYWYRSSVKSASTSKYMKPSDETEQVSAKNRRYAERIAQFCADHGAQLVLLSTPSTKNWNAKRHNGVAKLAEELGVEYMDLNMLREQVPIDWKTDSKDKGDHLNYNGARKVTDYLGGFLADKGVLVDHRGDAAYDSWNVCAEQFDSMVRNDQAKRAQKEREKQAKQSKQPAQA